MKKLIALITTIALSISMLGMTVSAQTYSDVPTDFWAYDQVERVSAKNWFNGYPDGRFMPDSSITRAEAMTVIVKFLGLELKTPQVSSYHDVDVAEWYTPYIEAGKRLFPEIPAYNGTVSFQPDMPMTRETTIYAMVIALKYSDKVTFADQSILNMFSDKNSISAAIKSYASVALDLGLVSGFPDGTIRGQDPLTRAEFATLLYRGSTIGFGKAELDLSDDNPTVMDVTLNTGSYVTMEKGETLEIAATATNSDGSVTDYTSRLYAYVADGGNCVTANANKITAVSAGTAEVKFSNDENLADKSVVVVVNDNTAENASFSNWDYPATTTDATVEISGKITGFNSNFKLYADDAEIGVSSTGAFTVTKSLEVGTNAFVFKAISDNGTTVAESVRIKRTQAVANTQPVDDDDDDDDNTNNTVVDNRNNTTNNTTNDEQEESATISGYEWSVNALNLDAGESTSIKLFEKYTDGTKKDVTRDATYSITNDSVAEISSSGKITAKAAGSAYITASFSFGASKVEAPKTLKITVTENNDEAAITALEWSVDSVTLGVGSTKKVKLMAVYDNGTKKDVTAECELYIMDEDIASVSTDGTVKGLSSGETAVWFNSMPAPRIGLPQVLDVVVE